MKKYLLLLGIVLVISPFASQASDDEKFSKVCQNDALGLCFFDVPNKKKITQCLIKKKEKVSNKCKPYIYGLVADKNDPKGYRRVEPIHLADNNPTTQPTNVANNTPADNLGKDSSSKTDTSHKDDSHAAHKHHKKSDDDDDFVKFFDIF